MKNYISTCFFLHEFNTICLQGLRKNINGNDENKLSSDNLL